jgi:hypothetical protein
MSGPKMLLAVAATAVIAATLAPTDALAHPRWRGHVWEHPGVVADFGGAYGYDAFGYREFSYGPNSCFRRVVVYTRHGPRPRQVSICSYRR